CWRVGSVPRPSRSVARDGAHPSPARRALLPACSRSPARRNRKRYVTWGIAHVGFSCHPVGVATGVPLSPLHPAGRARPTHGAPTTLEALEHSEINDFETPARKETDRRRKPFSSLAVRVALVV